MAIPPRPEPIWIEVDGRCELLVSAHRWGFITTGGQYTYGPQPPTGSQYERGVEFLGGDGTHRIYHESEFTIRERVPLPRSE